MGAGALEELFSELIAKLILKMYADGYRVRCGDFMARPRDPLEHKANSRHYDKCAGDLNLFKDGVWLSKTEDHKDFGAYWESLHPNAQWGGRWNDGNHYEIRVEPRKY